MWNQEGHLASTGISEFTFGFAFLHEQVQHQDGNFRAMPVLPSLQDENELGWDAHLPLNGTDYYYQFKLSEYLSRRNAKYIVDGTFSGPYYRIWLHRHDGNKQHRLLRTLSQQCPNTYYVAPELNTRSAFDTHFLTGQITEHSRLIPLTECRDINDALQHCICYQNGTDEFEFFHREDQKEGYIQDDR